MFSGSEQDTAYSARTVSSESGLRMLDITKSQIEFLMSFDFSLEQMGVTLHVSTKTVQRRLRFAKISVELPFSFHLLKVEFYKISNPCKPKKVTFPSYAVFSLLDVNAVASLVLNSNLLGC
jgi:hypothetical protein